MTVPSISGTFRKYNEEAPQKIFEGAEGEQEVARLRRIVGLLKEARNELKPARNEYGVPTSVGETVDPVKKAQEQGVSVEEAMDAPDGLQQFPGWAQGILSTLTVKLNKRSEAIEKYRKRLLKLAESTEAFRKSDVQFLIEKLRAVTKETEDGSGEDQVEERRKIERRMQKMTGPRSVLRYANGSLSSRERSLCVRIAGSTAMTFPPS
ncbi:hypothetical protein [Salinibacter ruber]|uniref:hypothetical protein n=1 Tax=Salinibacter ruber TaxID=146919 RepID=UPI0013C2C24D|nr:hypothetical protein [Salinibacter ruber]